MSNPESLAWALEMWGWGFSGLATCCFAPLFLETRLEHFTRWLCVANGALSLAGTAWTVAQPGWMLTRNGLLAFGLWNLLFALLAACAGVALRRRARGGAVAPEVPLAGRARTGLSV